MADEPHFRDDLYRGTAAYYDEFRVPYPRALTDDVLARCGATSPNRLLDLGCGTGQITFALCEHFAEVWAVDLEPETIAFARDKASRLGVENVEWFAQRAELVDVDAFFSLVTAGNSFHRLPRERVAASAMQWLAPGGHIALVWSDTPWVGPEPWQHVLQELSVEWLDRLSARDRVPASLDAHMTELPNPDVLRGAGFEIVGRYDFVEMYEWSMDALVGWAYSTSLLPLAVVGEHRDAFERDMHDRLLAVDPSGVFPQQLTASYDLARRP